MIKDDRFKAIAYGTMAVWMTVAIAFFLGASMDAERNKIDSFVMGWPTGNMTTRPLGYDHRDATDVDSLGYVTGTGRDTTAVIETRAYHSSKWTVQDTSSGGDSVAVTILAYYGQSNQYRTTKNEIVWDDYSLVDSLVISNGVTDTLWVHTSVAVPVDPYLVYVVRGNADNKKASAVTVKSKQSLSN